MNENRNSNKPIEESHGFTKPDVIKLSYEWKINNFSVCDTNKIRSPTFSSSDNNNIKWVIDLHPKGLNETYKSYLSLFLHLDSIKGSQEVETIYTFYILNKNRKKSFDQKLRCKFAKKGNYGFCKFVARSTIMNDTYLPNDCLTIVCDIIMNLSSNNEILQNDDIIYDHVPQFKLLKNYETFFTNQELCDLTILLSGKELRAHKTILSVHSPIFLAMFKNNMKENNQNQIEITDIEFNVFQELLRFIYSGKVENMSTMVYDLLIVADKYSIEGLLITCEQYLESNLNVDNVTNVLTLADNHNADNLKKTAIHFIITHRKEILNKNDFKFLGTLRRDTVEEIAKLLAMQ